MATWQQPPKEVYQMLTEYMDKNFGEAGYSMSCDAGRRVTHIEIPSLAEPEMNILIVQLQNMFPGAF